MCIINHLDLFCTLNRKYTFLLIPPCKKCGSPFVVFCVRHFSKVILEHVTTWFLLVLLYITSLLV